MVSFLSMHIQKPDEDDYKKLALVMKYLQGTINLPLTIEADETNKQYIGGLIVCSPITLICRASLKGPFSMCKVVVYGTST